ncbi:MAG: trigger factor [Oscillospiraceae bacterium]|nr:trigger factor [Oscillospiraceae bacterium]
MNITAFEKKEKSAAGLTVEIEADVFNGAVENVYRRTRGKISVPGFRPGKAPRKIIENLYGASVFRSEALDELLPAALEFGVKEKALRTVGYPRLGEVSVNDDKSVTVTFDVSVYPEVEIGEYKGLRAVRPSSDVPESAVDSEIEALRLRNASRETVARPAVNGDTVTIDYSGTIDGKPFDGGTAENYELELGSGAFIPGFEEKLHGMTAGETRDIDVSFPENYDEKRLAGRPAVFRVTLHEVRAKILPEADDEFAKDVSEFDTIAEYRADIRKKFEDARRKDADEWFENALLDALAETVTGEIPEDMFEENIDSSVKNMQSQLSQYGLDPETYLKMSGMTLADYRRDMRPRAEKQVKVSLALEKIAEKEGIEPAEEQIEEFYVGAAARYGVDIDTVKKSVDAETAKREAALRAAVRLVVDSGIAEPVAEEASKEVPPKDGEAAKPKRARRAPAKPKAEAAAEPVAEVEIGGGAVKDKEPGKKKTEKKEPEKKEPEKKESAAPAKKTTRKSVKDAAAEKPPEGGGGEEAAPAKPKRARAAKPAEDKSAE